MLSYMVKRILNAMLILWVTMTITFFLMHAIPGGAVHDGTETAASCAAEHRGTIQAERSAADAI